MRKYFPLLLSLASSIFLASYTSLDDKSKIDEILKKVADKIQRIETLSYESTYVQNNPFQEDSISKSSGRIWLQILSDDTIFGCRFHVKGGDDFEEYDYYYDGSRSYEIRHIKKEITIFNPYEFPNTPNNPAKARTALRPFIYLLIDKNFLDTLLKNNPKKFIGEDNESESWIITFEYPENEWGQLTQKLFIDKSTFSVRKIEKRTHWRGMTSSTNIIIENYEMNNNESLAQVSLTRKYEDYIKNNFKRPGTTDIPSKSDLDGEEAPDFEYTSFGGKKVRLSQMRGKIVLLDFWESWCGYCILALPKINELLKKYGNNGLIIIGITTENREIIKKLIKANQLNCINIFADKTILEKYRITGRPTYYLIDNNGVIIKTSYGNLDIIEAVIKAIIE